MEASHLHILQHSLGLDQYGRGSYYRNHFVTGPGSDDHADCVALVSLGLMSRRSGNQLSGGDDVFTVTVEGKAAVRVHSPHPPVLTRSQQRYQDYLDADSSLAFIDWLKMKARRRSMEFAP